MKQPGNMSELLSSILFRSAVLFFSCLTVLSLKLDSASADTLLVGNKNQATVSFFDLEKQKINHVIGSGIGPHEIAISPNQSYAVVVNYGNQEQRGDSITLIDIATAKVINTVSSEKLLSPHGIQWFRDNQHILVTAELNKTLVKLNPFTGHIADIVKTNGLLSHMLVISSDEKLAAASNLGTGDVSIIDLKKFELIKLVKTGKGAEGIDITPDGNQLWVTNRADDTVSVLDLKTLKVIQQIPSKGFPIRVKITPDQKYALVSNATANTINIYSTVDFSLVKSMTLKNTENNEVLNTPIGILIDKQGKNAYVAYANSHRIAIIDLKRLVQTGLINAGPVPDGMGYITVSH